MAFAEKLKKGGSFALKALTAVMIECGWDAPEFANGQKFDIDVSAFWLGEGSRVLDLPDEDMALTSVNTDAKKWDTSTGRLVAGNHQPGHRTPFCLANLSMFHYGDALTGTAAVEIEERLKMLLDKAPAGAIEAQIWLTIYEAKKRGQHFGMCDKAFVRVVNADDPSDQKCQYDLVGSFHGKTAVQLASFMKQPDGTWVFHAIGEPSNANIFQVLASLGWDIPDELKKSG